MTIQFKRWCLALNVVVLGATAVPACIPREQPSGDAQVFELIVSDISKFVSTKPEINPAGETGLLSKDAIAVRSGILQEHGLKAVTDVGPRGCPGMTSIFTNEEIRRSCPKTPTSIVVINELINGVQGVRTALGDSGGAASPDVHSVLVEVYELTPIGTKWDEFIYQFRIDGGHVILVRRVRGAVA